MADDVQQMRQSQYKKKGDRKMDQVERRKKMLEEQKQRRYDYLQHVRMIAEAVTENEAESAADQSEAMEVQAPYQTRKERKNKKYSRKQRMLQDQLMLSEWMSGVPDDFETEWMLVPCPKGKRTLVIASGGITTAYSKGGYIINNFPSHLPGGNGRFVQRGKDFTILDCIVNEEQKTYYIIDIMCWKDHPIYDSETEFRFYWLHTKMQEVPLCFNRSKSNPYRFIPLPNYSCNRNNITAVMATPMNYELDGLLFYHKRAHYTFGNCPLVLWLKAHMLPDLMGIPVPDIYLQQAPPGYRGYQHFLEEMNKNREINQELRKKGLCNTSKKKNKNLADNFVSGGVLSTHAAAVKNVSSEETMEQAAPSNQVQAASTNQSTQMEQQTSSFNHGAQMEQQTSSFNHGAQMEQQSTSHNRGQPIEQYTTAQNRALQETQQQPSAQGYQGWQMNTQQSYSFNQQSASQSNQQPEPYNYGLQNNQQPVPYNYGFQWPQQ